MEKEVVVDMSLGMMPIGVLMIHLIINIKKIS